MSSEQQYINYIQHLNQQRKELYSNQDQTKSLSITKNNVQYEAQQQAVLIDQQQAVVKEEEEEQQSITEEIIQMPQDLVEQQQHQEQQMHTKSRGFGDTVEKIAEATGIKYVVDTVANAVGVDCGCNKRKQVLNEMFPYNQ